MKSVANDIGLAYLARKTVVRLTLVSLAPLLTIELYLLLCEYNKLELAFVSIAIFLLKRALSCLGNPFSFDVFGYNILLNSRRVIFLILVDVGLDDVVLLPFIYSILSNKVLN